MHRYTQVINFIKNAVFVLAEPCKAPIILTSNIFQKSVLESYVGIFLYFIRTRLSIYIFKRKTYLPKNLFLVRMRMCPTNKNSCCLLLLISSETYPDSSTFLPFAHQANP